MKFIKKITYNLEDLEYYRDELEWHVNSIDDVVERIKDWDDEELRPLLGYAIDYECWAEETEA